MVSEVGYSNECYISVSNPHLKSLEGLLRRNDPPSIKDIKKEEESVSGR
jgi:hypothetical protein